MSSKPIFYILGMNSQNAKKLITLAFKERYGLARGLVLPVLGA
jgi:hypothetical protein